jgi:hypothetical protein
VQQPSQQHKTMKMNTTPSTMTATPVISTARFTLDTNKLSASFLETMLKVGA